MKVNILITFILLSFSTIADDRPEAESELIAELKQFCIEVAEDEGTGDLDLQTFLIDCVNQELDEEGYRPIKKLE
jgi:hypothetical protein